MPKSSGGAHVQVGQLSKIFVTSGEPLPALDTVTMEMAPGEFVAIAGPSGCGKSTLLRILAGLDAASAGSVTVDGVGVSGPSDRHGVVFQKPALFPWLNVLDNVTFGPRMRGTATAEAGRQARHYLKAVGLEGFEHYPIYNLSGGMQHRVALARALISRPALLLMDEPFGALDAQTRGSMQELLMSIWQTDRSTVLFITHDVDEALTLADRILVMTARPGRIKVEVPVDLPRPRDLGVVTGERFGAFKREIVSAIKEEAQTTERLEMEAARHGGTS